MWTSSAFSCNMTDFGQCRFWRVAFQGCLCWSAPSLSPTSSSPGPLFPLSVVSLWVQAGLGRDQSLFTGTLDFHGFPEMLMTKPAQSSLSPGKRPSSLSRHWLWLLIGSFLVQSCLGWWRHHPSSGLGLTPWSQPWFLWMWFLHMLHPVP